MFLHNKWFEAFFLELIEVLLHHIECSSIQFLTFQYLIFVGNDKKLRKAC